MLLLLLNRLPCMSLLYAGWQVVLTPEVSSHYTRLRYDLEWSTVPCLGCRVLPPTCRDDAVQLHDLRLVGRDRQQQEEQTGVTSLEYQRDVSALVVQHKALVLEVPHLNLLRPPPRAVQRETRTTTFSDILVDVP